MMPSRQLRSWVSSRTPRSILRVLQRPLCTSSRAFQLPFIPQKSKEEMLELHAEDPSRWTPTTIAARFNASRDNVQAVLRLGKLRPVRETRLRDAKLWESASTARDKALATWADLHVPHVSGKSRGMMATRSPSTSDRIALTKEVVNNTEQTSSDSKEASEEDALESDVDAKFQPEPEVEIAPSKWAKHIEANYEKVEDDWVRKTTYAFIEVGKDRDVRRAVWLREGGTGKLRIADDEERRLFLSEVTARDTTALKDGQDDLKY